MSSNDYGYDTTGMVLPTSPAGTRVRETNKDLPRRRAGVLTGRTRVERSGYVKWLVQFDDGSHAWVTWLALED